MPCFSVESACFLAACSWSVGPSGTEPGIFQRFTEEYNSDV